MRRHAGPGFDGRDQARQRAHAHGFDPDDFVGAVDVYAQAAALPWIIAADVIETTWLLAGEGSTPSSNGKPPGIPDLDERRRRQRRRRNSDDAGIVERLIAGVVIGLGVWTGFALIHLIAELALNVLELRGTAVIATLVGCVLTLAIPESRT